MNLSVISAIARKLCEKVKNFFYQQPVYFPLIYKKIIKLPTLADEYSAPKNSTSTVPGYPHHLPEDKYPYPSTKRVPEDKYPYPGTKRVPDVGGMGIWGKGDTSRRSGGDRGGGGGVPPVAPRKASGNVGRITSTTSSNYHSTVAATSKRGSIHGRIDWSSK